MAETDKTRSNIEYTRRFWAGRGRFLTGFLYTDRSHYHHLYRFLSKWEPGKDNTKVTLLDIGFGSGWDIRNIHKRYGFKTIGTDIVDETVTLYNRTAEKGTTAIKIDPYKNKIPMKSSSVDFVVCSQVLEHVPDDRFLLKEIRRVLRKDGISYFNIPINEGDLQDPNHLRKYTPAIFIKLLEKSGFKVTKNIQTDNFTLFITRLGIQKGFFPELVKKIVIFLLSLLPYSFLDSFKLKKAQFVCFAIRT